MCVKKKTAEIIDVELAALRPHPRQADFFPPPSEAEIDALRKT